MNFKKNYYIKINFRSFAIFILFFLAIRPDSIPYLTGINSTYFGMVNIIISFFYILFIYKYKKSLSNAFILSLFFLMWLPFTTLIHKRSNFIGAMVLISSPLAVATLMEYYLYVRPWNLLQTLQKLFIFLTVIDLITKLLYPKGLYTSSLYTTNWFLGYKTARVRAVGLPAIIITTILSIKKSNTLNFSFWLISFLCIIDAFLSMATAGSVTEIVLTLIIFFLFSSKKKKIRNSILKIMNPKTLLVVFVVLNLVIAVFQSYSIFSDIISDVFNKNLSMSYRSRIWNVSVEEFLKNPILGNGFYSSSEYIELTSIRGGSQPHNLILGILVYSGLVGLFFYSILVVHSMKKANNQVPSYTTIILLGITAHIFLGVTSFTVYAQFHYALFVMMDFMSRLEKSEEKK